MGLSMAYGKADDEESMKTLQKAIDLGCTFWDSAVLYGSGHNEELIGEFFKETGTRDQVFFASKCGLEVRLPLLLFH
jgi:aryl-alcohol dehydrogenase-like predicted oxidoreductase